MSPNNLTICVSEQMPPMTGISSIFFNLTRRNPKLCLSAHPQCDVVRRPSIITESCCCVRNCLKGVEIPTTGIDHNRIPVIKIWEDELNYEGYENLMWYFDKFDLCMISHHLQRAYKWCLSLWFCSVGQWVGDPHFEKSKPALLDPIVDGKKGTEGII